MKHGRRVAFALLAFIVIVSCTSTKNTAVTRWYHSFNTRYNVYFNGEEAFKEALKTQQEGYTENYSEMIYMFPVSATPKDKSTAGGPFDKAIEKSVKAIKTHSITAKPEKQSGKRNDPKYQEFMNREEYNPFLYKAWMLMAKSQFFNGDFLESASSFSYISRHYTSQPEIAIPAKLWQARSYAEMDWFYEAEDILSKINSAHLSKKESELFATANAELLVRQKKYQESIPYLQLATKAEKGRQKARMNYLLGQIYTQTGQNNQAYHAFGNVIKANPPYPLEFSARIRQTEVYPGGDTRKVVKVLQKMAKSSKNKEYLDQVYYAMGNLYMTIPDTAKAVESYELGVEKSVKNGLDKAFCQVRLGDIYFEQRKYVKAQPCYSEALGQLKKEDNNYARVSKRSEALDELVVYYDAVQLQDSLQRLSRMSDGERLAVVTKIIETLKKEEEEAKKKAERESFLAEQEAKQQEMQASRPRPGGASPGMVSGASMGMPGGDAFYFYNPQAVAVGKNTFQQKWGRRKLEDDWRRRSKVNPMSDPLEQEETAQNAPSEVPPSESDSLALDEGSEPKELSSDPHEPQFYLQQIPTTEEDLAASDLIIMDGLFNMGMIYKDKLEDYDLSIESFDKLNTRFPDNENKLESYYNLYLIYLRLNDTAMTELYKSKIREEFPESDYAIAMADPDYEYNIRMMDVVQDSIYQKTYAAYLDGNVSTIRENNETVKTKYSQSKLAPKFMFLNALSYVMTQEPDTFKVRLKELIEKYPDADVSVLAGEMMKGFQRGLTLAGGDGNLAKGGLFNLRFGGTDGDDGSVPDSTLAFSDEKNTPYMLMLIYPKESINENMLLFMVASYNFGNFMVADFDLQFQTFGPAGMLQIKGFNSYGEIIQYWKMIHQPEGYAHQLENNMLIVPISEDNYAILTKGKSLEEYTGFFEKTFGAENAVLIEKWKEQQKEESEKLQEEEKQTAVANDSDSLQEPETNADLKTGVEESEIQMIRIESDQDTTNIAATSSDTTKTAPVEDAADKILDKTNEVVEKASEKVQGVQNFINEIASDPIRGLRKLFQRKKSNAVDEYAKQLEKEEKERQKQLKKQKDDEAKATKAVLDQQEKERRELLKKQEVEEKALLEQKVQNEKELAKIKNAEQKQKEDDKKLLQKKREDDRKLKEQQYKAEQKRKEEDRKAKDKAYKEEQKRKAKEREETQKQKDADRKALQKQKDADRKAKEKAYKEEQERKKKARAGKVIR